MAFIEITHKTCNMGSGTSATQYKLSNSKHVHRNSKDYHDVMAKVRSTSASSRRQSREAYKYVTGDTLLESNVEDEYASNNDDRKATKDIREHAIVITDGETLLFSDCGNPFVVPGSDHTDGRRRLTTDTERLIHVDVDGGNNDVQHDRFFMVGV